MTPSDPHASARKNKDLTVREILRFYLPLVLTSQMMTLSGPIINVGISRTADPKLDFAAFWLAFAVMLFLESPVLVIQQITASLVNGYRSVRKLYIFSVVLSLFATVAIHAVAWTPVGDLVIGSLIPTTPRVAELARQTLLIFSIIPILIAIRGVANGIAIKERRTVLVARATFLRLIILSGIVGGTVLVNTGSGSLAGASALVSGIALEMAMVVWAVRPYVLQRKKREAPDIAPLRYRTILRVAAPMFVSAIVWTIMRPITNSILGKLPDPELAQAAFGFVLPLVFVTCSPLWAIQNVAIVLPETRRDLFATIRFAVLTATFFSVAILILTWTPLRDIILVGVFDLTPEMLETVRPAIYLIALEPFFLGSRTFTQGLLMKAKRTGSMLVFSPVKVILFVAIGVVVTTRYPGTNGAVLGTALLLFGDLFDGCVYGLVARRLFRRGELLTPPAS